MKLFFKNSPLLAAFFALAFLPACKNEQGDIETRNEATVRAILAAMDAGEVSKFDAYCASDFRISNPFLPTPGSIDVFKGLIQGQKTGFPDMKHEIVQMFSQGNMVCGRGVFSGTNTGTMQGNPPTGNRVTMPFIFTDEFDAGGKVKARHVQFDTGMFMAQLMAGK